MENNIQVGSAQQSLLHEIKHNKQEKIKEVESSKTHTLEALEQVSVNVSLNKSGILDLNNIKGFLELSKESVKGIDDGISKLNDLNNAFNSLEVGHADKINILNRSNEIVKDIQNSANNANFNEQSVTSTSSHNIGSNQISVGSNNKQENSQVLNIEKIDEAIELLTKSKANIETKIDVLNEFISNEESSVGADNEVGITRQELELLQENLRDKQELFSISHKASNQKMASLFF